MKEQRIGTPDSESGNKFDSSNEESTSERFAEFVSELNQGVLEDIFEAYRKPYRNLPTQGRLFASPLRKKHSFVENPHRDISFYNDAEYAVTVSVSPQDSPPIMFGILGFMPGNGLRRYDDARREKFGSDSIVVVQLQGPGLAKRTQPTPAIEKAKGMFGAHRTEHALLTIPILFGKKYGAGNVYVLPGMKNRWTPTQKDINTRPENGGAGLRRRLVKRYDGTAESMGFEKVEKGFYRMRLNPSTEAQ